MADDINLNENVDGNNESTGNTQTDTGNDLGDGLTVGGDSVVDGDFNDDEEEPIVTPPSTEFTPAMTSDQVSTLLRENKLQTGVMNPVSDEDKEELGQFASVTYRGNRPDNEFLKYQVKKQDEAAKHTKLYSYGF